MYHRAVLLEQAVKELLYKDEGVWVDVTFGGGGHSSLILEKMSSESRLVVFDKDTTVANHLLEDNRFQWINADFANIKKYLRTEGITKVNGILADIGVSSHQFDTAERGFSIRMDGPLDMRMDTDASLTAASILQRYNENQLMLMFENYGEITNGKTIAQLLIQARQHQALSTTFELKQVLQPAVYGNETKFWAKVFQALRIEVNNELQALQQLLIQSASLLEIGGCLVVIAYHSLEDRLVKNFIKHGTFADQPETDEFGKALHDAPFKPKYNKPIIPSDKEIKNNPRARSAKMRIAIKK